LQDILSLDYFLYECAECTKTNKKKKNGRIFFFLMWIEVCFHWCQE